MKIISRDFQVPVSGLENSSWNLEPIPPAITIPNNLEELFCFFDFYIKIFFNHGAFVKLHYQSTFHDPDVLKDV